MLIEFIKKWVSERWNERYVDRITDDLIEVYTGNRTGNGYEQNAVKQIQKEYERI